jgi:hypothetical protein
VPDPRLRNCFGVERREAGQSRVPPPPAKMTECRISACCVCFVPKTRAASPGRKFAEELTGNAASCSELGVLDAAWQRKGGAGSDEFDGQGERIIDLIFVWIVRAVLIKEIQIRISKGGANDAVVH